VTIPQGQIGYVFARDGAPLGHANAGQQCGHVRLSRCARVPVQWRAKGPQRTILREGTYAINTAQFVIITREQIHGLMLNYNDGDLFGQMQTLIAGRQGFEAVVIKDSSDQIGIVTVHDGPALNADHIIAPEVGTDQADAATFHNSSRTRKSSSPQAAGAGASFRCWWKAAITSTACSPRWKWWPRR
jgi:hypothetical protein